MFRVDEQGVGDDYTVEVFGGGGSRSKKTNAQISTQLTKVIDFFDTDKK